MTWRDERPTIIRAANGAPLLAKPCAGGSAIEVSDPHPACVGEKVIALDAQMLWSVCQRPELYFTRPLPSRGEVTIRPQNWGTYGGNILPPASVRDEANRAYIRELERNGAARAIEAERKRVPKRLPKFTQDELNDGIL